MIKLIKEPSVYLVGSQSRYEKNLGRFLADIETGWEVPEDARPGESLVEIAGRLCYMSFDSPRPGGNKAYIEHILEVGHGSVLEHAVYSMIITGVSRSLTHEFVRHRVGFAYSQLSQRYHDESECSFVVPPILTEEITRAEDAVRSDGDLWNPDDDVLCEGLYWLDEREDDLREYRRTSDYLFQKLAHIEDKTARRKQAREAARAGLPNCTETKLFATGNARAWRHFIELRGSEHADAEIRRLANVVLKTLHAEAPHIFGDYVITDDVISTQHRKV